MTTEISTPTTPEKTSTSHLFPYPNQIGRFLLRSPLFFYRLGLGDLLNVFHLMVLTTRGHRSGMTRHTPIDYRQHGSKVYLLSAWGERPTWFRNIQADPNVKVQQGRKVYAARARIVDNPGEALRVLHLFRRTSPIVYDMLLAKMSASQRIDANSMPEISKKFTLIRLDPQPDNHRLTELKPNLLWVWGVVGGVGMLILTALIVIRRRKQ